MTLRWKILPHEWAFGGFLLLTFARLLIHAPLDVTTAAFLAFLLVSVVLIVWTQDKPTPLRWRLRLLWYPCVMGMAFYVIPQAVTVLDVPRADTMLAPLDQSLLGMPVADYFLMVQSPLVTDVMTAAYIFFFCYLIIGPGYYCIFDMRLFRACFAGMFTTYALGFIGYTFFRRGGPYQAVQFIDALPEGPVAERVLGYINHASNGVDVFPSIHVAITMYLLLFDRLNYKLRYEILLVPCILLWLSTMYLRYHYAVDVIAGAAVALIGLGVSWLYQKTQLSRDIEQDALLAKLRR